MKCYIAINFRNYLNNMSSKGTTAKFNLIRKYTLGSILLSLFITAIPLVSAAGISYEGNRLPFLREASRGDKVVYSNIPYPNGNNGSGNNVNGGVNVPPGGLISQANGCRFQDIKGNKSETAINYLYDKGIAGGRRPCYFDPNLKATRAEAATMVVRAVKAPVPATALPKAFPDTDVNAWSAKQVKAAKNAGIVHGYPDTLYRAEKPVNKVEALKIVTRGFNSDFSRLNNQTQLKKINDIKLDQWYVQYVNSGMNEGLIAKDATSIQPAENLTRAELAEMVFTMLENRESSK